MPTPPRRLLAAASLTLLLAGPQVAAAGDDTSPDGDGTSHESDVDADVDEAWRLYHRAFRTLATGFASLSVEHLVRIRSDHPDHPAALFARPVLNVYRQRTDISDDDIPPREEWRPMKRHPAYDDRDSAVYDPAWARYREAFVRLARRRISKCKTSLKKLQTGHPTHPAAALATEIVDILDRHETSADASSEPDDSDPADGPAETDDSDPADGPAETEPASKESADPEPREPGLGVRKPGIVWSLQRYTVEAAVGFVIGPIGAFGTYLLSGGGTTGAVTAVLSYPALTGTGIWLGGRLVGGRGGYRPAVNGAYVGALTGLLVGLGLNAAGFAVPELLVGVGALTTTAGGVLAYELSNTVSMVGRQSADAERPAVVQPAVAPTPEGITFGFHTAF